MRFPSVYEMGRNGEGGTHSILHEALLYTLVTKDSFLIVTEIDNTLQVARDYRDLLLGETHISEKLY